MTEKTLCISLPLITHIPKTRNKKAADKYIKINNQAIYNGALNTFARAIVVENMHSYFMDSLPDSYLNLKIAKVKHIEYIFHTVINHGSIQRRNGAKTWKPAKDDYEPNWDLNNLSDIWIKTANDALVMAGVLTDDNVGVIQKTSYEFREVKDIGDLEMVVLIHL